MLYNLVIFYRVSFARMSCTRLTLLSFPWPDGMGLSTRVPIRMSVATRGVPIACTAAWQSWIAWETLSQGPSV